MLRSAPDRLAKPVPETHDERAGASESTRRRPEGKDESRRCPLAEGSDHVVAETPLATWAVKPFADDDGDPTLSLALRFLEEASNLGTRLPGPQAV